jgi:preprotein translocase subunit SecG
VTALITIIHVLICMILIVAVLLQSGKAADLAGAFGGVGSQTAFGARGSASLLSKVTTICAILFMFTSLGLWVISGREAKSVVTGEKTAPAKPAAAVETKKEPSPPAKQPAPKVEEKKPAEAAQQKKAGQEPKAETKK